MAAATLMKDLFTDAAEKGGLADIMDFEYIAYGNAQGLPPNVQCQHGPEECLGNTAEECAKAQVKGDPFKYMPFADCLENNSGGISNTSIASCAKVNQLDGDDIASCVVDGRGDKLIVAAAKNTVSHKGVPWILLNGNGPINWQNSVLKQVCDAYTGTKPAICSQNTIEMPPMCLNEH
eukprot:TRINITY_DN105_c0_g3_i1.p2 TRINITY_DN105_c0_g3~~TRINITY_DN105_c0_g3_i1.p2  ORF type:complete len:178 (+),score=94.41 TRINITY_DN105_c0_g3_i1:172-705(+)